MLFYNLLSSEKGQRSQQAPTLNKSITFATWNFLRNCFHIIYKSYELSLDNWSSVHLSSLIIAAKCVNEGDISHSGTSFFTILYVDFILVLNIYLEIVPQ